MNEEAAALALAKAMPEQNNTDELRATLQKQLRAIVDRPLTSASLRELSGVASNAQQLLVSLEAPGALPGRRPGGGITMDYALSAYSPMDMGANSAETFGTSAIRELTASANKSKPLEIIRAIAEAKKLGLDESIIEDLKSQLPGNIPSGQYKLASGTVVDIKNVPDESPSIPTEGESS